MTRISLDNLNLGDCEDIEQTYAELSERGVGFPAPPVQLNFGWWSMFEDWEGTRFALGHGRRARRERRGGHDHQAGIVDELTIIAPVVLGGGKRLFEDFSRSLNLEHLGVRQSPFATFIDYRLKPS